MTRSYKKHPCYRIAYRTGNRDAARAFRRYKGDVTSGSFYRKVYNSYDVVDYIFLAREKDKRNFKRYLEIGRHLRHHKGTEELWEEFNDLQWLVKYFYK